MRNFREEVLELRKQVKSLKEELATAKADEAEAWQRVFDLEEDVAKAKNNAAANLRERLVTSIIERMQPYQISVEGVIKTVEGLVEFINGSPEKKKATAGPKKTKKTRGKRRGRPPGVKNKKASFRPLKVKKAGKKRKYTKRKGVQYGRPAVVAEAA